MPQRTRICSTRPVSVLTALFALGCPAGEAPDPPDLTTTTATATDDPTTTHALPTTTADGPDLATTTTSTDATTTTGEDPATTGNASGCGDGALDPGEECDDGFAGNDDSRYCTADCTLNVCGDGKLLLGWELCDEGPANSDEYGHLCSAQCTPGARCGDHQLQPEYETCDLGPANGGPNGDEQGILCSPTCRAQQLRAFVTDEAFDGFLDGLVGADERCREAAAAAALPDPDRFHALLSSDSVDAADRFASVAALPYVLVTGKKIADDFTTLLDEGPLGEGISTTEHGTTRYMWKVATNTAPGGLHYSPDKHCQGWTSNDPEFKARVGINAVAQDTPDWAPWHEAQAWIGQTQYGCDKVDFHLYCLEL